MKPSETFDRYNPPSCEKIQGLLNRISRNFLSISILQAKRGTGSGAGIGLGVKSPVPWVFVFFPADGAHPERSHGGFVTIVRNVLNDGKSRAAEGAVDERISMSKVSGGKKLGKTRIAGGKIRRNEDEFFLSLFALSYFKKSVAHRFEVLDIKRFNPGERGRELRNVLNESVQFSIFAFGIDENPLFVIDDPSADGMCSSETVDKGPEPDSLTTPVIMISARFTIYF